MNFKTSKPIMGAKLYYFLCLSRYYGDEVLKNSTALVFVLTVSMAGYYIAHTQLGVSIPALDTAVKAAGDTMMGELEKVGIYRQDLKYMLSAQSLKDL